LTLLVSVTPALLFGQAAYTAGPANAVSVGLNVNSLGPIPHEFLPGNPPRVQHVGWVALGRDRGGPVVPVMWWSFIEFLSQVIVVPSWITSRLTDTVLWSLEGAASVDIFVQDT
jgi:hypothetical protein